MWSPHGIFIVDIFEEAQVSYSVTTAALWPGSAFTAAHNDKNDLKEFAR